MPYCTYLRKSRADAEAEARGEGETLERHRKILFDLAKRLHLDVTKEYAEIVSGETIASRPVVQELLADVEQGLWNGVLVVEVERLARGDTIDQGIIAQTFKFSDTKIITPMKTYDPNNEFDEEYFEFGLFMSRREYKTINRRLQNGRAASVREGKYVGNKPPYGYTRKKLDHDKGYTLLPHPDQAKVIQLIFQWYTEGLENEIMGPAVIATKLTHMHIPPQNGDAWVPASIRRILRNPTYTGKVCWERRKVVKKMAGGQLVKSRPDAKDYILADGLHEALIPMETWNKAQEVMTQSHVPSNAHLPIQNPLAGLVFCSQCGRRMIRRPFPSRPDTLMCPLSGCSTVASDLDLVESRILESLSRWLRRIEVDIQTAGRPQNNSAQIELFTAALNQAEDDLATLQKQVDSLYDLLEQGIYTKEVFLQRSKVLSEKLADKKKERSFYSRKLEEEQLKETQHQDVIPAIEHALEIYDQLETAAEKNRLLKSVLDKIIYSKSDSGRWHGSPDAFELEIYPKTYTQPI